MQQEDKLEKIEMELQKLRTFVMLGRDSLVEMRPVSLGGICRILVPDEELNEWYKRFVKNDFFRL